LSAALAACPHVRFLTPLELAHAIEKRDPAWIEGRLRRRLAVWRVRLDEVPHFRRMARLSGLALPLAGLGRSA